MNTEKARFNMIEQQIRTWNVFDPNVLNIMASVPRELFVPEEFKHFAFTDMAIPFGHKQMMFTPKEEARMLQSISLKSSDKVLEIGTGTGFTSALMSYMSRRVVSLDFYPDFIIAAKTKHQELQIKNIDVDVVDVSNEWTPGETFDVIACTAAYSKAPEHLFEVLKPNGRLFCILGLGTCQTAYLFTKQSNQTVTSESLYQMSALPLVIKQIENEFVF